MTVIIRPATQRQHDKFFGQRAGLSGASGRTIKFKGFQSGAEITIHKLKQKNAGAGLKDFQDNTQDNGIIAQSKKKKA